MLDLSMVTLLCVDSRSPELATWALKKCLDKARFAKTVLLTDKSKLTTFDSSIEYLTCPPISSTQEYSEFMLRGITPYVTGSHVLVVQWDGFILHPDQWDPCFLNYDYIGAVWPQWSHVKVGNGGFSLRSLKLLKALQDPQITVSHPEDLCICETNRELLENNFDIKFATEKIADSFSVERGKWHRSFGFHGFFNFANALSADELTDFIRDVPSDCCGGVDCYDLIEHLRELGNSEAAMALFDKCRWKRKTAKRFLSAWIRSKTTGF